MDKSGIESAEKFLRLMQNMRTLSFDIMLLQLEQFRSCYERIKAFGNKTVEYITKGRDVLDVLTAEYEALAARESNFFAKFYLERLWDTYLYNRTQLNNIVGTITNAVTNRKTEKDFQRDLTNLCNEMERIVLTDWHYNHITDMETVVFRCNVDSVILRGDGVNQMFRVTDGTLLPLLYEYSYIVENMGLSVFECAYCHKHYLNTSDNVCCTDEKCREQKIKDFRTKSLFKIFLI